MRKIIGLVLAMVMTASLAVPALAEGQGTDVQGVVFDYSDASSSDVSPLINEENTVYVGFRDLYPADVTSDNNWSSQRLRVTVSDFTDTLKKVTLIVESDKYGVTMSKPLTQGQTSTITIPADAGSWTLSVMSNSGDGYLTLYVRD